jgi:hypothetical protein
VRADADRVMYCAILDSVPSAESCSSSSNDSSSSESVMASPPPVLDVHISTELPHRGVRGEGSRTRGSCRY